jgi:hypothetical protein
MILAATSVKVFMFVTFLSTGSEVKYQFDTEANCKAAMPPVVQLYKSLGDKVNVSCIVVERS